MTQNLAKPALLHPIIGELGKPGKDKNNIAPSLGFAWDVRNDGKTVIRGGAGIYYDTVLFVTRLRERAAIGPLGNGRSQVPGAFFRNTIPFPQLPPPLNGFNVFNPAVGASIDFKLAPTKFTGQNFLDLLNSQAPQILGQFAALGKAGVTGIDFFKTGTDLLDPNLQTPYSEQISIGFQRQLPHNMAISTDFVFRQRVRTLFQNDLNLFNRVAARGGSIIPKCVGAQAANPAVQCSNGPISIFQSSGREKYKALLVKLDKRFSNRYQFTASYALSSLTGYFTDRDLTNWFGHHGPLDTDARHRFTFSGVVDLLWEFQASMIAVYSSRAPFNARVPDTIDLNGDGTTGDNLPGIAINSLGRDVGKDELRRLVNEFNTNFAGKKDAQGTTIPVIVLPRDFDFGDNFQSHDLRITRSFKLTERYSVQLMGEVFNLFNISNLAGYSANLGSNFGQPTLRVGQNFGTGGPRALQFGRRFRF